MTEPAIGMLASAAGVATIITLIMNAVVRPIWGQDPTKFDRLAPAVAVLLGIIAAVGYVVLTISPITGADILQGVLVGLFAGSLSQNVNTVVTSLRKPTT